MDLEMYDVVIIGGGPAGLAAGLEAKNKGAGVLIVEREKYPGGILKQCIHDGFGLVRFGEKLSGPEYAERYINMVLENGITILAATFVTNVKKENEYFEITLVNSSKGVFHVASGTIILANGCRERTSKQASIHGTRPAGVYTAGLAQYLVNILGYLPCKRCVILGSGDIGLIMARRLTLEGAEVIGVYEAKGSPSGLDRNIAQCLNDYNIPLHLSRTITRIEGSDRVEGVEISEVDENMNPCFGTEEYIECDGVILSVGLIPENEIAESMGIELDKCTKGPIVDQNFMTVMDGVFSCGNALHVNDLVDYVSESGELAGRSAAIYAKSRTSRRSIPVEYSSMDFSYAVPQRIDLKSENKKVVFYIRSREVKTNISIKIRAGDSIIFNKKYRAIRPPEMERLEVDLSNVTRDDMKINIFMEG